MPPVGDNTSMGASFFFAALRRPLPVGRRGYMDKNEFLGVEIAGEIRVLLVLMADWWIDQIVPLVADGAHVERGQVIGKIRMGSQVDLWSERGVLAPAREIGERVRAGEAVIARLGWARRTQRSVSSIRPVAPSRNVAKVVATFGSWRGAPVALTPLAFRSTSSDLMSFVRKPR